MSEVKKKCVNINESYKIIIYIILLISLIIIEGLMIMTYLDPKKDLLDKISITSTFIINILFLMYFYKLNSINGLEFTFDLTWKSNKEEIMIIIFTILLTIVPLVLFFVNRKKNKKNNYTHIINIILIGILSYGSILTIYNTK